MAELLMKKATAVWLIDNTSLTFEQIAHFCGLHVLEIQTLADQEHGRPAVSMDPITAGDLTWEDIERCQQDPKSNLVSAQPLDPEGRGSKKIKKYTPLVKRQDRPDAIAWLVRYYPALTDHAIMGLLGTTKKTIEAIRNKTHWNMANIKPRNPVVVDFCSQAELDHVLEQLDKQKK